MNTKTQKPKNLEWIGSSKKDVRSFPEDVKDVVGFALRQAQNGGKHEAVTPLKGFGGAGGFLKLLRTIWVAPIVLYTP